jgi:hypothetical protein
METVKLKRILLPIASAVLVSSCHEVAYEYGGVDKKTHTRPLLGSLDVRADHALCRINDHTFEYDLRPIGNALIHSGAQSAQTLKRGESLSPFLLFRPGLSTGAGHKTRFGGSIALPKKPMSLDQIKPRVTANSTLRFEEVSGRRWIVESVFKDSAKKILQAEEWACIIDGFFVSFWMHVDDLAPLDTTLRNSEVARLRALVRGFRYSP